MKTYGEVYARAAALNIAEDDGRIWMALLNRNGICEVDKETDHARIVKTFEGKFSYFEKR